MSVTEKATKPPSKATIAGGVAGRAAPLALMLWAATETDGPVRWALLGWVAFVFVIYIGRVTVRTDR